MAPCTICKNLDIYQLRISFEALQQQARNGCPACNLLQEGISRFMDSVDTVTSLDLLVDSALYVTVFGPNQRRLNIIEYYTDIG
jgi:hypothetical protein